jgi:hypothetical protein
MEARSRIKDENPKSQLAKKQERRENPFCPFKFEVR